jgi:hypothetical protein
MRGSGDTRPAVERLESRGSTHGVSAFFDSTAFEKTPKFVLGIEPHGHAPFAVGDRDGELPALAGIAAAMLDYGAWQMRIAAVVPLENLHVSLLIDYAPIHACSDGIRYE